MNYVVICMDSVRYDSYCDADTPNFDFVGQPKKVYSVAAFTTPSIVMFLMNHPQYESDEHFIPGLPVDDIWLPTELSKNRDYHTAFIHSVKKQYKDIYKDLLGRDFTDFIQLHIEYYAANKIIDEAINIFRTVQKPKFIFMLFLATHNFFSDGRYVWVQENIQGYTRLPQVKSIEAVDKEFGRLLPFLKDTEVIITADHGELFGENGSVGHNPKGTKFHPKLFEVPKVVGTVADPPPMPEHPVFTRDIPKLQMIRCPGSGMPEDTMGEAVSNIWDGEITRGTFGWYKKKDDILKVDIK